MLVLMFLDRQGICLLSSQFSKMNYTYQAIHASSFQLLFLNVLFLKNTYFKKKETKLDPSQAYATLQVQRCCWWGWLDLCRSAHKDLFSAVWSVLPSCHLRNGQCNSQSCWCWPWSTALLLWDWWHLIQTTKWERERLGKKSIWM